MTLVPLHGCCQQQTHLSWNARVLIVGVKNCLRILSSVLRILLIFLLILVGFLETYCSWPPANGEKEASRCVKSSQIIEYTTYKKTHPCLLGRRMHKGQSSVSVIRNVNYSTGFKCTYVDPYLFNHGACVRQVLCLREKQGMLNSSSCMILTIELPIINENWHEHDFDFLSGWEANSEGKKLPRFVSWCVFFKC